MANNTYTLTLDPDGGFIKEGSNGKYTSGNKTLTVTSGNKVGTLPEVSRIGYVFKGWYKKLPGFWGEPDADDPYKDQTKLKHDTEWTWNRDLTFTARWEPEDCTITWDGNGGKWRTEKTKSFDTKYGIRLGKLEGFSPPPTMPGRDFIGWFTYPTNGQQINEYTQVEGNRTYYAHWKDQYFTVTLLDENNKELLKKTVKYGDDFDEFINLSKRGYKFNGWKENNDTKYYDKKNPYEHIVNDLRFTPCFAAEEYDITYTIEPKYIITEGDDAWWKKYTIEKSYPLPGPVRSGYNHLGWKWNGNTVTELPKGSTGNRTYVSKGWEAITYKITLYPNLPDNPPDDSSKYPDEIPLQVVYDKSFPEFPSLPDYEIKNSEEIKYVKFIGWFVNQSPPADPSSDPAPTPAETYTIADDSHYYARWQVIVASFHVVYDGNGATNGIGMPFSLHKYGIVKRLSKNKYVRQYIITYSDAMSTLEQETRETINFPFLGWATTRNGNIEYVDEDTITIASDDDNIIQSEDTDDDKYMLYAKWKEVPVVLNQLGHEGYTLEGWYSQATGGTKIGDGGEIKTFTQDTILYARWTPQKRTVSFNQNGGVASKSVVTVNYNETIGEIPTATREGYVFVGWFTQNEGGEQLTKDTRITENVVYYARWQRNTIDITFRGNGGYVK